MKAWASDDEAVAEGFCSSSPLPSSSLVVVVAVEVVPRRFG